MRRLETLRRLESSARTYASKLAAVFESGTGVRMRDQSGREVIDCLACAGAPPLSRSHPQIRAALLRFITSDHVRQVLDLTTLAKFELVQELSGLLPTPAKLHLTFPDTRGCWKSPPPD
jgi:diaminobutyrate-2-oxoglutarate transaminase